MKDEMDANEIRVGEVPGDASTKLVSRLPH